MRESSVGHWRGRLPGIPFFRGLANFLPQGTYWPGPGRIPHRAFCQNECIVATA